MLIEILNHKQLNRYVPIIGWVRSYRREWLRDDLVSGVIVGMIMIPVAMAYAQMAGVPPQAGLYSAIVGMAAYAIFATSRHMKVPTSSTMSIIVASIGLIDIPAFRYLRQVRSSEFWLAVVTTLGVLVVGVLQGILVAVMLSLINVLYHISKPHDALLDDIDSSGGAVYREIGEKETSMAESGLIVYRFDAPLVFANAGYFSDRLEELVANAGEALKCIILDAEAISDFDSTAADALADVDASLEKHGVELWIARANEPLRELLQTTGLSTRIGEENIYPSVRAAVNDYRKGVGRKKS